MLPQKLGPEASHCVDTTTKRILCYLGEFKLDKKLFRSRSRWMSNTAICKMSQV